MRKLSIASKAYIAGFLDGDGSIYVRLKPNTTYRFQYQVSPNIVFFQAKKERVGLEQLQSLIGIGYLRDRKDGIVEYTIGDMPSIRDLLHAILPYLRLKKRQAHLMLKILLQREAVRTSSDFLKLCALIDEFQKLNYSKRRQQTSAAVEKTLRTQGLLTP